MILSTATIMATLMAVPVQFSIQARMVEEHEAMRELSPFPFYFTPLGKSKYETVHLQGKTYVVGWDAEGYFATFKELKPVEVKSDKKMPDYFIIRIKEKTYLMYNWGKVIVKKVSSESEVWWEKVFFIKEPPPPPSGGNGDSGDSWKDPERGSGNLGPYKPPSLGSFSPKVSIPIFQGPTDFWVKVMKLKNMPVVDMFKKIFGNGSFPTIEAAFGDVHEMAMMFKIKDGLYLIYHNKKSTLKHIHKSWVKEWENLFHIGNPPEVPPHGWDSDTWVPDEDKGRF